jgi:2-polyprenyl-3-methyl-5-hydroxy-6-metoxy-1,4-benzoquinol methylase
MTALNVETDKTSFIETNCPLCWGKDGTLLYSFQHFDYLTCTDCGLVYLNPRLTEEAIKVYYTGDDFYAQYSAGTGYEIQELALRKTFRKFLKQLKKKGLTGGRLLEIGCGYGFLLDEAKNYFSYRVGTEFSPEAVTHARHYADEVFCGGLESLPDYLKEFDCVITFSVIEHVYHPNEFIADIESKLVSNGRLIISTSNVGNFWRKILKSKWPLFIPPEHVCLYDNHTIIKLLKTNNFKDVRSFDSIHAWPLAVFISKLGVQKVRDNIRNLNLDKFPILVPKILISVSGRKI